jgi:hypothetical protein
MDLIEPHRPGGAIYVCTDALREFSETKLPHINSKFVLVTGDSDTSVTDIFIFDPLIKKIVDHKFLVNWYAQNLNVTHEKLFHLPIGLDYHTMWERPGFLGMTAVSAIAQEQTLISRLESSPQFNDRYLAAYCNWHFAIDRGDRRECFEKIDKSACYFELRPTSRGATWARQAECMFVVSPEGAGIDCHRSWEAITLGCIPIMKRNSISVLFKDLPALFVDDWAEVNRSRLNESASNLVNKRFDFNHIFTQYWKSRISANRVPALPSMTLREFRNFLTRKTG